MKAQNNINYGFYLSVFILGFLYLLLNFNYGINSYDEGVGLLNAARILDGDLPYRDFWTIYSPGSFYLTSLILAVTNHSIFAVRIFWFLQIYTIALLLYFISKKISNEKFALLPFISVIIFFGAIPQNARAIVPALLTLLLSVFYLFKCIELEKNKYLHLSGIFAGLLFVFRYDFGFYLLGVNLVFLIIVSAPILRRNFAIAPKSMLLLLSSQLMYLMIMLVILFLFIPFNDIYEQFVRMSLQIFPANRSLPAPFPFKNIYGSGIEMSSARKILTIWEFVVFYIPLVIASFSLIKILKSDDIEQQKRTFLIYPLLLVFALFGQASVRSDVEHAIPSLIISILFLSYCLFKSKNIYTKISLLLLITFVLSFPVLKKFQTFQKGSLGASGYYSLSRAYGISSDIDWKNNVEQTVSFVKSKVPENGYLFVGNKRHNKLVANNVVLYFLAERKPCSRYHELHPGVATREDVQREIISDMKEKNLSCIVLFDEKYQAEPNNSSYVQGSQLLDNYISDNFKPVRTFGNFTVYLRK